MILSKLMNSVNTTTIEVSQIRSKQYTKSLVQNKVQACLKYKCPSKSFEGHLEIARKRMQFL